MHDSANARALMAAAGQAFNPSLVAAKEAGRKVIGVLYNQVPEEIITAAGMVPWRVWDPAAEGTMLSEGRLMAINCSLVRTMYDSAARGHFGFLDGLVGSNGCDHVRKLHENWVDTLPLDWSYFLCFPKKQGEAQAVALAARLRDLAAKLGGHYGVTITDEALVEAIKVHNTTRQLQIRLYDLRAGEAPKISGADALRVLIAGTCMPREEYNALLAGLLDELEAQPGITGARARVVLYGGEIFQTDLLEAIESQGALIVGDSLGGWGKRNADFQVSVEGDPYLALADAYLNLRPGEPRIFGTRVARDEYLLEQVRLTDADGIISIHLPICDLWSYERRMIDDVAEDAGIPCLALDTECIFANVGQTKTRVQAFVESIEEER